MSSPGRGPEPAPEERRAVSPGTGAVPPAAEAAQLLPDTATHDAGPAYKCTAGVDTDVSCPVRSLHGHSLAWLLVFLVCASRLTRTDVHGSGQQGQPLNGD